MPLVDIGDPGNAWTPPQVTPSPPPASNDVLAPPQPSPLPYTPVPGLTNNVTAGTGLTEQQLADMIANDPTRQFEWDRYFGPNGYYTIQQQNAERSLNAAISAAQASASGYSSPDYSKMLDIYRQQTDLEKSEATRKAEESAIYNWERLASMGQATSGTPAVEADSARASLDALLKQADLGYAAQVEQVNISKQQAAAARAAAQSSANARIAQLQAEALNDTAMRTWQQQQQAYTINYNAAVRQANFVFDESSGLYRGPNGATYTPAEASAVISGALGMGGTA